MQFKFLFRFYKYTTCRPTPCPKHLVLISNYYFSKNKKTKDNYILVLSYSFQKDREPTNLYGLMKADLLK